MTALDTIVSQKRFDLLKELNRIFQLAMSQCSSPAEYQELYDDITTSLNREFTQVAV